MRTGTEGAMGSGMFATLARATLVEVAVIAAAVVGTVEYVWKPVRSTARMFRLNPPLRFGLGSPNHAAELRRKTAEIGMA
jgi:hypothetical protein